MKCLVMKGKVKMLFNERRKSHHDVSRKGKKKSPPASREEVDAFLQTKPEDERGVIYFHVPYCDNICSFCSMNRTKLDGELDSYTEFLLKKIDEFCIYPYIKQKKFESIYFGGGTPTILKTHHLEKILTAINEKFNISPTCEFNFESTLHNLSLEKIKLMQSLGVNRYSIGVQTFSNAGRVLLNRVGDKEHAVKKLETIRQNFDGNMCIDIIYNYPKQTLEEVKEDARIAKELGVDSSSFYSLMFHDGSVLSEEISPKDYYTLDLDRALHDEFLSDMLSGDYEILEYTKVAKKGRDKYKYIRLSHEGVDILPLGVGAGGRLGKYSSFTVNPQMQMFMPTDEIERRLKRLGALFQYPNIKYSDIKKFVNEDTFKDIYTFLQKVEKEKYIKLSKDEINFELGGIFWGNTIAGEVLDIALRSKENT